MADKDNRNESNIAGLYYVDDSCIDCDMCRENAESFFRRDDDIGLSIVFRQPLTADEIAIADAALENCPTQSIGNDGE
jgi:ferredoxin